MRATVKGKTYDTETAELLESKVEGEYGDTRGYEEKVYRTKTGLYFIHGVGGADSPYPKETIKPLTQEEFEAMVGKPAVEKSGKEKAPSAKAVKKTPVKAASETHKNKKA